MSETYRMDIKCWNCGFINFFDIPIGTKLEDYLDRTPCENCGCHTRLK